MEEEGSERNLETIINILENIERENLSGNEEIQIWLNNVTKSEFQLIDSLINLFTDHISDYDTTSNILKVLR